MGLVSVGLVSVGLVFLVLVFLVPPACAEISAQPPARCAAVTVDVTFIPFDGPLQSPEAEVSGLAWDGVDTLVIMPQHPEKFGEVGNLGLFVMMKQDISQSLEHLFAGRMAHPLHPEFVYCRAGGMMRIIQGFDGLEAIGGIGNRVYMTVEASEDTVMAGYLVSGLYVADENGGTGTIDMTRMTSIPMGLNIPNIAEESMIIAGDRVITMSEANGRNLVKEPRAKVFNKTVDFLGSIPFPHIEYRVTDATALDENGRFWVMNFFYPGEAEKLKPAADPEVFWFGPGEGQIPGGPIERLLELRLTDDDRIVRTETPPIYLRPAADGVGRNWEALVRLDDRGFLLMTDQYPGTLLGFVPNPYSSIPK